MYGNLETSLLFIFQENLQKKVIYITEHADNEFDKARDLVIGTESFSILKKNSLYDFCGHCKFELKYLFQLQLYHSI